MGNVLTEIVARKRERLAEEKRAFPLLDMKDQLAEDQSVVRSLSGALRGPKVRVIAEIKRASPSEGLLNELFDPRFLAQDYAGGGAAAISVITEQDFFQGEMVYLKRARKYMPLPVLRKDFLVEPYQIYQSRWLGADALLLIAAILEDGELTELLDLTAGLGMQALVETHTEAEIERALSCGAQVIGINNRDLTTLKIDLANTERLARLVPVDRILVAESGVHGVADIERVAAAGVDAVLVGTMLMKSDKPGDVLRHLVEVPSQPQKR